MSRFRVNQLRIYFLIVLLLAGIESSAFAALADEFTPALNSPMHVITRDAQRQRVFEAAAEFVERVSHGS